MCLPIFSLKYNNQFKNYYYICSVESSLIRSGDGMVYMTDLKSVVP